MSVSTRALRHADPFTAAQREFDVLFGRLLNNNGNGQVPSPFPVDVREVGDTVVIEADLPGFAKEQIAITLENDVLTLSADRNAVAEPAPAQAAETQAVEAAPVANNYIIRERRNVRFQRSFTLPNTIDGSSVNAKLENGVLTVTLNKRQEAKPRKIVVA